MTDIVTLKAICDELKIDPREARERLRAAASDAKANPELAKARKPRTPWQWVKGLLRRRKRAEPCNQLRLNRLATPHSNVAKGRGAFRPRLFSSFVTSVALTRWRAFHY